MLNALVAVAKLVKCCPYQDKLLMIFFNTMSIQDVSDHNSHDFSLLSVNWNTFLWKIAELFAVAFFTVFQSFEFSVFLHLDWLPHKVKQPRLPCYLTRIWWMDSCLSQVRLCESECNGLVQNVNSAHRFHFSRW